MGDVVQFSRKPPEDQRGELIYSVHFYDTPGQTDVDVVRHDATEPDPADIVARLQKLTPFIYEDLYGLTDDQDNELKLTMRVFGSSRVSCTWLDDDLLTPAGTAWLRRRFDDAYHDLDRRRGLRYFWYKLKRAVDTAWRNLTNKDDPK